MSKAITIESPVLKIEKVRIHFIDYQKLNDNPESYKKIFYWDNRFYAAGKRGALYTSKRYWHRIVLCHRDSSQLAYAMYKLDIITFDDWRAHECGISMHEIISLCDETITELARGLDEDIIIEDAVHIGKGKKLISKKLYNAAHKSLSDIRKHLKESK